MSVDMFPDAAVDYLIENSDRIWCVFDTKQHGLFPIEIRGGWPEIQQYAEMRDDHILFFGPPDLFSTFRFEVDHLIRTTMLHVGDASSSGANPSAVADGSPSGTGVGTEPPVGGKA